MNVSGKPLIHRATFLMGLLAVAIATGGTPTQAWQQPYEEGKKLARSGKWKEARTAFRAAIAFRSKDSDRSEQKIGVTIGTPYSPNFLGAYACYRMAIDERDPVAQTRDFKLSQGEFEHLDEMGQKSVESYFFLNLIYIRLNESDRSAKLAKSMSSRGKRQTWKVDDEIVTSEEMSAMSVTPVGVIASPGAIVKARGKSSGQTILAGDLTTGSIGINLNPTAPGVLLGSVPKIGDKFAVVIGEDVPQLGGLKCASYDAQVIHDSLVSYAGYEDSNILLIQNAPAQAVMDKVKAFAANIPQDGVLLIFYAGSGTSVRGKDYLGAANSVSRFDTFTMVAKADLYNIFIDRGARIFSFYEVNRPIENGYFFGSEVPVTGSIAQMEATVPDAAITATVSNQHQVGLYASAFANVLAELRSNRVPIYEFGWQVYDKMKRGNSGWEGGGSHQTPTLPVLNNLASDARF